MPILTIAFVILAVGVLVWAVDKYATMVDPTVKKIFNFVLIGGLIVWLLNVFGVFDAVRNVHVGKVSSISTPR